ncbi:MAG: hypothetical protein RLZZ241_1582 [Bacteroidota bacterium]
MLKAYPFSFLSRQAQIESLEETTFDLIVIGGGVTGAGIALDASSRGLKTLLLEKGDFASGTSSKSTKLIHGGLRYLKQFDFWLVKEVGSERAIVHELAPHLVLPEKMLLPLVEGGSYGKWLTSFGLKVYDLLAQVTETDKRQMLDPVAAIQKEPLLPVEGLNGAGYYAEYRTDDARLTLEILKTSLRYGALVLNYIAVEEFIYDSGGRIKGVRARDVLGSKSIGIKSKNVINAAGPWVDALRTCDGSKQGKELHLTKGVHLVFPHHKFPVRQSVYFDVPDGRMIFAIPRGNCTYVGTTDTDFHGNPDNVHTDLADAVYLIAAVNHMFPSINLELEDIESSWAGLRPLIHEAGKSASELSRKDEIFISPSGLLSIAGGKLTGYRKMAERAVNRLLALMEEHGQPLKPCFTEKIPLCGNTFKNFKAVRKYAGEIASRLEPFGISEQKAWELVTTYGSQTDQILGATEFNKTSDVHWQLLKAEVDFCIGHEMATSPADFFMRRTGKLYFDIESVRNYLSPVIEVFREHMKATEEQVQIWADYLELEIRQHTNFDPNTYLG